MKLVSIKLIKLNSKSTVRILIPIFTGCVNKIMPFLLVQYQSIKINKTPTLNQAYVYTTLLYHKLIQTGINFPFFVFLFFHVTKKRNDCRLNVFVDTMKILNQYY